MKKTYIFCIILACATYCFSAHATSPVSVLEGVSNGLIKDLKEHQDDISKNHKLVVDIISQNLIPHVDKSTMAKLVIGPRYWPHASQQQQEVFKQQFVIMITNNYANIFSDYSGQTVQFLPMRNTANKTKVEVKSIVSSKNKRSFKVNYKMIKNDTEKAWYIYDFSIDGISMLESYKSQFAQTLSESGLSGLIVSLKSYNNKDS